MSYRIEFNAHAARQFRKFPREAQRRIAPLIDSLAENPRPAGVQKLSGEPNTYRIRSGDYRILYEIEDRAVRVLVLYIGHRRDVYKRK